MIRKITPAEAAGAAWGSDSEAAAALDHNRTDLPTDGLSLNTLFFIRSALSGLLDSSFNFLVIYLPFFSGRF